MILHRDGWRYSGRVPAFFSGQAGCGCCAASTAATHLAVDKSDGTTISLRYDMGSGITGRCIREVGGKIYAGGGASSGTIAARLDSTMAVEQTFSLGATATCFGIDCDASGNVALATGYIASPAGNLHVFNSSGVRQWSANVGGGTVSLSFVRSDSSGNWYVSYVSGTTCKTDKYDSSGSLTWSSTNASGSTYTVKALEVDSSNNSYTLFNISGGGFDSVVRKLNTSGTQVFFNNINDLSDCGAMDSSTQFHLSHNPGAFPVYTNKIIWFDSSGTYVNGINVATVGFSPLFMAFDSSDNMYVADITTAPFHTNYMAKWNSSKVKQFGNTWPTSVYDLNGMGAGSYIYLAINRIT